MKNKKVMAKVLAALVISTSILTSCGGNDAKETSSASTGGGGTTASPGTNTIGDNLKYDLDAPVNDGEKIEIDFWIQNELQAPYEKWIEEYTKVHPNVTVKTTYAAYADHFQKVPIALQSGTGPDIFHMHNSQTAAIIPNTEPYPEDVLPIDVLKEDFLQVEEHLIDGKLYFIDMGVMTSGIFYNKDMWEEAGLTEEDIPKTWDDLVAVAQKLTKTDSNGKITREGMALNEGANYLLTAINMQKGNFMFDEEGKALINTPDMKESMQFIVDFYDKYKVSSIDFPLYSESFANQQAAMTYSWGWYGTWLNGDSYKDLNWGFFNLPTVDGETPPAYDRNNGESTAAVSAKTGDKEKAVAFDMLKYFLCNDELLVETNMALSTVPVKLSLQNNETIASNIVLGTQAEILDRTYWPGAVPDPYFQGLLKYVEQDVLLNGKSIDDALENAETVINKDLEPLGFTPVERLYQYASEFKN